MAVYQHDVLVVGAGLAGMRATLAAQEAGADVAMITKVHPVRSHSNAAQGGINAALESRGDNWDDHAYNTVKGSDYLGDQDAIEIMCQEAGPAVLELEQMGVIFMAYKYTESAEAKRMNRYVFHLRHDSS